MTDEELLDVIEKAAKEGATSLNLSEKKLTTLPKEIGNLNDLTELYLNYNQLTALPAEFRNLTHLTALYLGRNPLTSPPPEIVEQGAQAVLAYLREQL